jgi:radical SAM superfamily enzyme YgiQ (UPF0313 family)
MSKSKNPTEILFVVPPFEYKNIKTVSAVCPHLGVISLAAVLEQKGYSVKVLDAQALKLTFNQVISIIRKINPKIVGITSVTAEFIQAKRLCKAIKAINNITTIVGGPHPTVMPQSCDLDEIDYIVLGEGEETIKELVDLIMKKSKQRADRIAGIGYRKNNKLHINNPRPLIENLDELPFPAYHLLPINKYKNYAAFDDGRNFTTLITSRGCPFKCIYCTSSKVFGHRWRTMSAQKVFEWISVLYNKYNIRNIYFQDDEFTINKNRVVEFCKLLIKNKYDLKWGCLSRVSDIGEELISFMAKAGCKEIAYGVETGYKEGLIKIRKGITLEQVRKAVFLTNKYKITAGVSFIMGFPWETKEHLKKTIKFAKSLPADMIYFQTLIPYPETEVYDVIKNEGLLVDQDWNQYVQHSIVGTDPIIRTRYLSNKELVYWNTRAYFETYFRPSYIMRRLKKIHNLKHLKRNIVGGTELLKSITKKFIRY